jgi:hypothetical protein
VARAAWFRKLAAPVFNAVAQVESPPMKNTAVGSVGTAASSAVPRVSLAGMPMFALVV